MTKVTEKNSVVDDVRISQAAHRNNGVVHGQLGFNT